LHPDLKEKTVKRFLISVVFACVLSSSVFAGDIPSGGFAPPVADGTTKTNPAAPSDIPTNGSAEEISDAVVSALLTVLGFLAV